MNTIKKAHVQLTLLNGCITTLILVTMTLGYLFISESNMMQNRIASYPRDIYRSHPTSSSRISSATHGCPSSSPTTNTTSP